jgi:hypothetical protein
VFYRVEDDHQFLFVYRMPERHLEALEIDRLEGDDRDGEEGEAGEVIHHLPVSRLDGRIQYLEAPHLPLPRRVLLALPAQRHVRVLGVILEAAGSSPDDWVGLARGLR